MRHISLVASKSVLKYELSISYVSKLKSKVRNTPIPMSLEQTLIVGYVPVLALTVLTKQYSIPDLFKSKKKPTLAAGPDTISHRHIMDLMPAIEGVLQMAIDKPLNEFTDIKSNYTRLLSKERKPEGKPLNE